MKYIIDHDLHIHSKLSFCSKDKEQNKENPAYIHSPALTTFIEAQENGKSAQNKSYTREKCESFIPKEKSPHRHQNQRHFAKKRGKRYRSAFERIYYSKVCRSIADCKYHSVRQNRHVVLRFENKCAKPKDKRRRHQNQRVKRRRPRPACIFSVVKLAKNICPRNKHNRQG